MSCPDWKRLVAPRRSRRAAEPEEWPRALAHLQVCAACHRRALEADPTLIFRRLPAPEVGEEEVEAVRRGVAALRRSRRLQGAATGRSLGRYAAAVLLAVGVLLLAPDDSRRSPAGVLAGAGGLTQAPVDWSLLPLLESVEPSQARVYQLAGGDELSVVMIVDEALDV